MTLPVASAVSRAEEDVPLVVDLDGTLVNGDTLVESVLSLIRHRPSCYPDASDLDTAEAELL